jgi:putative ABC transport system permease protein
MNWQQEVRRRLKGLNVDRARRREIEDELAQHLQDRYDELRAGGASETEARRDALAELGHTELLRELERVEAPARERLELGAPSRSVHDARGIPLPASARGFGGARRGALRTRRRPPDFAGDLRYAWRTLRKQPAFTAVIVLTLGLAVGANAAIFSVVNAVVLRPLPYRAADRLVVVWDNLPTIGLKDIVVSALEYVEYRTRNRVFDEMAAYDTTAINLTGIGEPERLDAAVVTASLFPLLGAAPAIGRAFVETENTAGRDGVAILSNGLWRRRFGSDLAIVGTLVTHDGRALEVIGVMPPTFLFPDDTIELWTPMPFNADLLSENNRGSRSYTVLARLKPGVSIAQAQAGMNAVTEALVREHADHYRAGFYTTVRSLQQEIVGDTGHALFLLLGAVGVVLLIACANIANLLLVRAHARRKEVAIRAALGARRGRIVRQLITESVVLALVGGVLGLLLAVWGLDVLVAVAPRDIPRLTEISIDWRVVGFALSLSFATGVVFGLAPALHATRADLNETLKEGGRATAGVSHHRVRRLLVVAEVGMSLVLLIAAGLLINSFARLQDVSPGFDPARLLTFRLAPPTAKYTFERSEQLFADIAARLRERPGIEAVSATNALPFSGSGGDRTFFLEGQLNPTPEGKPDEQVRFVTAGYFAAMRIPVRRGREFTDRDTLNSVRVSIINEALARKYWPNEDPIGKRLTFDRLQPVWYQVVGVVGNIKHRSLDVDAKPELYVPYSQPLFAGPTARPMFIVVRTTFDPLLAIGAVREVVASLDPEQPVSNVRSMEQRIALSLASRRFTMAILVVFAGVALLLAAIGIYGVVAYAVGERTHEIGVRLALGARPHDVLAMLVRDAMLLAGAGAALGVVGAAALSRVMAGLLFGVSATDPATFAALTIVLAAVSLCACYMPARRATTVNPVTALRGE